MVTAHTTGRGLRLVGVALVAMTAMATQSRANMYDFTTAGSSAVINGATFKTADIAPTGTGNIDSFVRIQKNGTEQGYNTDVSSSKFAYDEKAGLFTHSLLLSGVPKVQLTTGGEWFYEFGLDINQNGNRTSPDRLLSLDSVKIFREPVGDLHYADGKAYLLADLGTPIYDLDNPAGSPVADNWIVLDFHLGAGSGKGDMYAYIPVSKFTGTGDYVYLFSRFGDHNASNDGGEEWFVRTPTTPPPPVPAPAAVVLGMLGMGVAGCRLRRFA